MRLLWTLEAEEDLTDAYEFMRAFAGLSAADAFLDHLDRDLRRLLEFPRSAPLFAQGPWRRYPVQRYFIVYSADDSQMIVHALEHQLRSPERLRSRFFRR